MLETAAKFRCPNCEAEYKVVRVESPPSQQDRQLLCLNCGGPLHNRDGKFALKYFRTDGSGSKVPKWPSTEIAVKRTTPRAHRPKERGMNRDLDESSRQTAKMNRERLASLERPAIMEEEAKTAIAIRQNMARLRELRLAKVAQTVQKEIATINQPAKAKPKSDSDRLPQSRGSSSP